MEVDLEEERRVFMDTSVGEILVRQNADGSVSVTVEGRGIGIAIAFEAENSFRIIPNPIDASGASETNMKG
jgi:DNA gyrase/topoisomerase IV subunit B